MTKVLTYSRTRATVEVCDCLLDAPLRRFGVVVVHMT